jgi:phytoene synthase
LPVEEKLRVLDGLKKSLCNSLEGDETSDEDVNRFASTALENGLKPRHAFDLLEGLEKDCVTASYASFKELEKHCYAVASTVGLLLLPLLSDENPEEEAVALGKAMQLTNILRDVEEDFELGRVYLPQDEIRFFAVDLNERHSRGFAELIRFEKERAFSFYEKASHGPEKLKPSCRPAVASAIKTYSSILSGIRVVSPPTS